MILNMILWLSTIWLAPFQYAVKNNEAKFKKNIAVGVTFPYYGRDDEEVVSCITRYKKRNLLVCILLILFAFAAMFFVPIHDEMTGISVTLWFLWIDLMVILPEIPFVLCNRELKQIKASKGWRRDSGVSRTVDLNTVNYGKWTHPAVFFPGILLSVMPLLWDRTYLFIYLIMGISAVFCYCGYRFFYSARAEITDDNTDRTKALTRIRHYYWSKTFLIAVYSMALISLLFAVLVPYVPGIAMILIIFVSILTVIPIAMAEFKVRHLQEHLTDDSGRDWYVDDDDLWPYGIFYYNPSDSKTLVKQRTGMNMSVNLARTGGKIYYAVIALILILIPFTWQMVNAFVETPIIAEISDNNISWKSGFTSYEIDISEIEMVELIHDLPENMIRTAGTGAEHILRGNFNAKDIGHIYVCVDPTVPPFILVQNRSGQTYLLGTRDADQTETIFQLISK